MLTDLLGNQLEVNDLVSIKTNHVIGQVLKVESGTLARGISLDGKPSGELLQPHVVIQIRMDSVSAALPSGQCPDLLKVCKPEKQ